MITRYCVHFKLEINYCDTKVNKAGKKDKRKGLIRKSIAKWMKPVNLNFVSYYFLIYFGGRNIDNKLMKRKKRGKDFSYVCNRRHNCFEFRCIQNWIPYLSKTNIATATGDLLQFLASNFQRVNEADYDIVARCFKCTGFIWIVNFILWKTDNWIEWREKRD